MTERRIRPRRATLLERDAELAAIRTAFQRAANVTGRVLHMTGEPGTGKSAVAHP